MLQQLSSSFAPAGRSTLPQRCASSQSVAGSLISPGRVAQQQQQQRRRRTGCSTHRAAATDVFELAGRFPQQQQQQQGSKYVLGELLGSGTAARVVVGTDEQTGQQYAIKVQPKRVGARNREQQIKAEIAISKQLRHCRHAVRTLDWFEDARHIYVVQELCCGGDLSDLLSAHEGQLSQAEAASVTRCVLEFLADCHARSICYGDVKPNNFVLRSLYPSISHLMDPRKPKGSLDVVAVDFGCCQEVGDGCLPDAKVTGTPVYMAPENMKGCHGVEVDVWAAGVMLYQLLSDRFPFWDVDIHQMDGLGAAAIRDGILHGPVLFPAQPWSERARVHSSAVDLISRMLERDPARRITAAEALKHPWFAHALAPADA